MYLAKKTVEGRDRFVIRESYARGRHMLSRDLYDLGAEPGRFIVYPGGRSFYVDPAVEDALREQGVVYEPWELDDLFLPFLDPQLRWKMESMAGRRRSAGRAPAARGGAGHHRFDKRRMLYLRCGRMHQGSVGRTPEKLMRALDGKSRDEIEQIFMAMEEELGEREIKSYVFVIFDLQRFFSESYALTAPHLLDEETLDEVFVAEICRLQGDGSFWGGMDGGGAVHAYLLRYLILHFDHDFPRTRPPGEALRDFMDSRRAYRPPRRVAARLEEAAALFGTSSDRLRRMDRKDLARLYRRCAQKHHPDKGGDHDAFVTLTRTYHALMRRKP